MAKRQEAPDENGKMKRKLYEKELRKLQVELCHLQDWVKAESQKVIIVFEGRDAAGKGGTIKALTERVSPRVFRVVALPAPSDREKTSSSTAVGITGRVSNASWGSLAINNPSAF
jgi:polyphosphate kinase 2 (PPK2 family)